MPKKPLKTDQLFNIFLPKTYVTRLQSLLLIVLLYLFLLSGCSTDEGKILGTWAVVSMISERGDEMPSTGDFYYHFKRDGFYNFSYNDKIYEGTWTINPEDHTIHMELYQDWVNYKGTYELYENELSLKFTKAIHERMDEEFGIIRMRLKRNVQQYKVELYPK